MLKFIKKIISLHNVNKIIHIKCQIMATKMSLKPEKRLEKGKILTWLNQLSLWKKYNFWQGGSRYCLKMGRTGMHVRMERTVYPRNQPEQRRNYFSPSLWYCPENKATGTWPKEQVRVDIIKNEECIIITVAQIEDNYVVLANGRWILIGNLIAIINP